MSKTIFKREGFWWKTMGYTKTHLKGVFITESILGLLGIICIYLSFEKQDTQAIRLLIQALCIFLLQLIIMLSSILSLLFYSGSNLELKSNLEEKENT